MPVAALAGVAILAALPALAGRPSKRLSDEARGELLYQRHCIACHGPTNAGDGPATEALVAEVPDLRGQVPADARKEQARLVLRGEGAMPGFEQSFDKYDARRVLRYMEDLPAELPDPEAPAPDEAPPGPALEEDTASRDVAPAE